VINLLKIILNRAENKPFFILALYFAFSFYDGFSQNQQPKPTRQSALDAFSRGDFEKAYIQFNELSANYPGDPLYKYYDGVSLVKLEGDPLKAISLLKEAQLESGAIRTIPSDGLFYLGRAQQMSGDFTGAIKSYNLYTEQVGKRTAKENSTPQFIQQCNERKGAIILKKTENKEILKKDNLHPADSGRVRFADKIENIKTDSIGKKEKPVSPEYEKLISESLNYQFSADSIRGLSDLYRKQYEKASVTERPAFKTKISDAEQLAAVNQGLADDNVLAAETLTKIKPGNEVPQEKKNKLDSTFAKKEIIPIAKSPESNVKRDTSSVIINRPPKKDIMQKADNHTFKDTINQLVTKDKTIPSLSKNTGICSLFEIVAKPVYAVNEKVIVNPDVPDGLLYRIQLAVFRNPADKIFFKGINPVFGFKSGVSDVTNYYAGMFRKSEDASKALVKVKAAGFKDAFVVALFNKKIVSAERAAILEKEWGNKPFENVLVPKLPDTPRDTVPQTLIFRVEVTRSQKPLSNELLDNIKKLTGNRGLEIIKNDSGQNIYLIGKFLTFESAAEYADLLARNGQKEAKVAAYLGKREIPIETAKQLFDKF
jgi:hypothetical protein